MPPNASQTKKQQVSVRLKFGLKEQKKKIKTSRRRAMACMVFQDFSYFTTSSYIFFSDRMSIVYMLKTQFIFTLSCDGLSGIEENEQCIDVERWKISSQQNTKIGTNEFQKPNCVMAMPIFQRKTLLRCCMLFPVEKLTKVQIKVIIKRITFRFEN